MSKPRPKAAYFIHGRGRGHASRAPVVLRALNEKGFDVQVFAGGDAEYQLSDAAISFTRRAPLLPSKTALYDLAKRTYHDVGAFKHLRPTLVVSDGDHAALLAARTQGIPSIAIGHDLTFDPSINLPPLPLSALTTQRLNSLPTKVATRRIAVHFLPVQSSDPTLYVARPDVDPFTSREHDGSIVCYFRDNNGAAVAEKLSRGGRDVLWFTNQTTAVPGITILPPSVDAFGTALANCQAVVTSAGSNVLAQCIAHHKPVLALYRSGDTEQQLNALLIQHAAAGIAATFDDNNQALEAFTRRLQSQEFAAVDIRTRIVALSDVVSRVLSELRTCPGFSDTPPQEPKNS